MAEYIYECLECGNITYGYGKYKYCDGCGSDEWNMVGVDKTPTRRLDISAIKTKKSKIISTEKALKDVEPYINIIGQGRDEDRD